jgi:K+-transporting ATPase ATPase C chain
MLKQLKQAILATLFVTVLCGLAYPLAMTGLAGILFPNQAHGSLIESNGKVIGSELIGQTFTKPEYFHGRPSATTDTDPNDATKTVAAPYNAANSNASNAAPTAKGLVSDIQARIEAIKAENPAARGPIPVDLVTTSASGLDPHISPAAADYQIPRVAAARGISESDLRKVVGEATEGRTWDVFGEPRVNVLRLNLALDAQFPAPATTK